MEYLLLQEGYSLLVYAGGRLAPSDYNIIDYITIASTGNAADFGDLSETGECLTAASDNHGGLQA